MGLSHAGFITSGVMWSGGRDCILDGITISGSVKIEKTPGNVVVAGSLTGHELSGSELNLLTSTIDKVVHKRRQWNN